MKRTICLLLTALMLMGMLVGCQKTPESPIVIGKDNELLIEKAVEHSSPDESSASLRDKTQAGESYEYDFESESGLIVHANALVSVPNASSVPIVRVAPGKFSQQAVSAWWELLVGDTPMFKQQSIMTKAEIEAQIIGIRNHLANEDYTTYENADDAKAQDEADLAYYESIYDAAPEEWTQTPADGILETVNGNPYMGAMALEHGSYEEIRAASDSGTTFLVENFARDKSGVICSTSEMGFGTTLNNRMFNGRAIMDVEDTTTLSQEVTTHLRMTPAEARKLVQSLLEKTGTDFAIDRIVLISDAEKVNAEGDTVKGEASYYAYSVSCKRIVNDIPCMALSGSTRIGDDSEPEFSRKWSYETLNMIVHDSGLVSLSWVAPLSIEEAVVESCELLPFSDITAIFEKMMWVVYDYRAKEFGQYVCNVDNVKLELMRVIEQDSVEKGLLVPVWNFYGTRYGVYNGEEVNRSDGISLLTINAIDGSIVDLGKGY